MLREGEDVARCTGERTLRSLGAKGVIQGKKIITPNPDMPLPCPDATVICRFKADRPNELWDSDFTHVPPWSGTVCVAFVIDVFARPIVALRDLRAKPFRATAWRTSTSMKTPCVLDALEQAVWQGKTPANKGLSHHSDRPFHGLQENRCRATGSQYPSIEYAERLAETEIALSVGAVGDACDKAQAECGIGLFKTEVINQIGP